jgi:hypothetical protein
MDKTNVYSIQFQNLNERSHPSVVYVDVNKMRFKWTIITSGRYDTEVINSAPIFFSILCRAARVVEEPAEETTTSGK